MKGLEKILFFYGIFAITSLFISFGIFSPLPLNFISIALLIPIIFYFWIRLTNPERVSAEWWSAKFILSLIILSTLGIFGYRLAQIKPSAPVEKIVVKNYPTPFPTPIVFKNSTPSGESVTDLIFETPTPTR